MFPQTNRGGPASNAPVAATVAQEYKAMNRSRLDIPGSRRDEPGFTPTLASRAVFALRPLLLAALAALSCAHALAATTPSAGKGYRLAGVMLVGKDRIGFLEVPAGGQVLVRLGSTVDGGKVTVFNDRELRIAFPDRSVVLALSGGATPPDAGALGVVAEQYETEQFVVTHVDSERMAEALEQTRQSTATAPASRVPAQVQVGRLFAAVANLPPSARVVAVNNRPVLSAARAVAEVEKTLARGEVASLSLESPPNGPPRRVYLAPVRRQNEPH
jgi:hypothetical protein